MGQRGMITGRYAVLMDAQIWSKLEECSWGKAQTMQRCRMYKSSSERRSVNEAWGWNNAAVKDAQIKSTMEGCAVDRGEKKFMQQWRITNTNISVEECRPVTACSRYLYSASAWMVCYVPYLCTNTTSFGERRGCAKSSFHLSIIHHSLIKTHTTH
jgi:hypothetical protein